jgi:hypothetical protein
MTPSVLALGWATVELERAAQELTGLLADGAAFHRTQASIHLGAYAWLGRLAPDRLPADAPAPGDWLVLLEPSTEGLLAATLARHGEGWCATWSSAPTTAAAEPGPARSLLRPGPIGDERLLLEGPRWGPHRILVERLEIHRWPSERAASGATIRP